MGIPAFYKHLIQTIGGLTSKTRAHPPKVFGLDLNCAIYHCVRKVQKRLPYAGESNHATWERELIQSVIQYIKYMDRIVKPSEKLVIAVDGVAPMAKIKQQRMRRFKSAVGAEEEGRIAAVARGIPYTPTPRWDTNAITPGTAFMAALAAELRAYADQQPTRVVVSPADEPGEGEQKLMDWIRQHKPHDVVVYGLDADLIVLSLWAHAALGTKIDLFREETEFNGAVKTDLFDGEQFMYFTLEHLAAVLHQKYGRGRAKCDFIQDFVAIMNLLGNDFVPHGMALKIRDNGIEQLLETYQSQLGSTSVLTRQANGSVAYNVDALKVFFGAVDEPATMLRVIKKKLESRVGATHSKDPVDIAMARHNDLPVSWAAERIFLTPAGQLRNDWAQLYDAKALLGANPADVTHAYLQSLAWNLAYYAGEPVDMTWYYPWALPPRIQSVLNTLESTKTLPVPRPDANTPALQPQEQLAMVLPQSSFHLLPKRFQDLPQKYPYAWPSQWSVYSFGRRFLWECEPEIPLITPQQMRHWLQV